MENGPVGSFGEGGVADSFPADGAHRLFRYHATTGLEEYLLIGRLQMFGEEQRLEYLSVSLARRLFLDNILQEQADVADGDRRRKHFQGLDGVDGAGMRLEKTQRVPDAFTRIQSARA